MSRADPALSGPELWDWLRTESLDYYENAGDWPISTSPQELAAHIQEFATIALQPGTVQVEDQGDHTLLRGRIQPRFSLVQTRPHIPTSHPPTLSFTLPVMQYNPLPATLEILTLCVSIIDGWRRKYPRPGQASGLLRRDCALDHLAVPHRAKHQLLCASILLGLGPPRGKQRHPG